MIDDFKILIDMQYVIDFYRRSKALHSKVLLNQDDFSRNNVFIKVINNSRIENNFGCSLNDLMDLSAIIGFQSKVSVDERQV